MRVVVHRVDRPGIAGVLVAGLADAENGRIAHVDVARGHVDLRAQRARAIGELAGTHALEQVEVLGDRAFAERRVAPGFGQRAAIFAHLVGIEITDKGLAVLDQLDRTSIEHLEIIRGMPLLGPVEAQPAHVFADRLDILDVLARGVGVIETQIAGAAEITRDAEIQADALGMAEMQVAVRLRRKARLHDTGMLAAGLIGDDDLADEIGRGGRFSHADKAAPGGIGSIGKFNCWGPGVGNREWPWGISRVSRFIFRCRWHRVTK